MAYTFDYLAKHWRGDDTDNIECSIDGWLIHKAKKGVFNQIGVGMACIQETIDELSKRYTDFDIEYDPTPRLLNRPTINLTIKPYLIEQIHQKT